jgi:serine/threonine protein phosphatase 1
MLSNTEKRPTEIERERLYVIGDIHGRLDLLDRMINTISRDLKRCPIESCLTVTIGDYIDRGPSSRSVVDRLARNPFPTEFIALRGNHDGLVEEFIQNPSVADVWRRLGGLETLHSYGVPIKDVMNGKNYEKASEILRTSLPESHREFFNSLRECLPIGDYFLCHAGVRPGIPLSKQCTEDLLWIREPFLRSNVDFSKIIVHGHTPVLKAEVLANRINVDTGAYITGRLTCAVLEPNEVRFLAVT